MADRERNIAYEAATQDSFGKIKIQTLSDELAVKKAHGLPDTRFLRIFCSKPSTENGSPTCSMDGVTALGNYVDYYDRLCSSSDHQKLTVTVDSQRELLYLTRNSQQALNQKDCQTFVGEEMARLGFPGVDFSKNPAPAQLAPDPEFEVKDECEDTVVLLLDKSGSMAGTPLIQLKVAVVSLIDLLGDNVKLGIVWFDSQPVAAVGIQKLGDSRALAKQAIAPIDASGGTRIGFGLGVAYEQLRLFRDPDKPRGDETIYLVTDGISSDETDAVVNTIKNDGVKIRTIALGDSVDTIGLFEMALATGGESFVARDNEDIARVVVQGTAQSLENYFLLRDFTQNPQTPIAVTSDSYVEKILIQLRLSNIDSGALDRESFQLTGPNGTQIPFNFRFEPTDASSATVVLEVARPVPGMSTLSISPSVTTDSSQAEVFVFGQSKTLVWDAFKTPEQNSVSYPNPVYIKGAVESTLGSAHGLDVTAVIKRPDSSEVTLKLYDNGSAIHGDEVADDGVYGAKFLNYSGDGTYDVTVTARNDGTALLGAGLHTGTLEPGLEAFERLAKFSFEVSGFIAPETSALTLSSLTSNLDSLDFDRSDTGSVSVPIGGFQANVGPGQGVRISKIRITPGSEELFKTFSSFAFFIDGDGDGLIDFFGPNSVPKSVVKARREGEHLILDDVLELPGDSTNNILILGHFVTTTDPGTGQLLESGVPLVSLLFIVLFLPLARHRKTIAVLIVSGITLCFLGCGGGDADYVVTSQANSGSVTPISFESTLNLSTVEAVGLIDGQKIDVRVGSDPELTGPSITIR